MKRQHSIEQVTSHINIDIDWTEDGAFLPNVVMECQPVCICTFISSNLHFCADRRDTEGACSYSWAQFFNHAAEIKNQIQKGNEENEADEGKYTLHSLHRLRAQKEDDEEPQTQVWIGFAKQKCFNMYLIKSLYR